MITNDTALITWADEIGHRRWTLRDLTQFLFFAVFIKPLMRLFIGCRVEGKERLPLTEPFVLIANHSSHLDAVSLLNLFPLRRIRMIQPVAAADYFERHWAISWFSRTFFNILPIERHRITAGSNPLDLMIRALRSGKSLILFPEGTRGNGEMVGEFRAGIAHLVEAIPDLVVVPAQLENMNRCLPKDALFPVPLFCTVRLGEPRRFQGNRREILSKLKAAVTELN